MFESSATRFSRITRFPAYGAGLVIRLYQLTVSPALAVISPSCGCRFTPTCSHYARDALREHGLFFGLSLTARRLSKCAPWHPGGHDPVQSPKRVCTRTT